MKKLIAIIITTLILGVTAMLGACGGGWQKPTLTTPGAVVARHGFMVETENYVYFINGVADKEGDNTFGKVEKGSLMVATKQSILEGKNEAQVVVPKLFIAEDLSSSFYIFGDYVYYGTPSVHKSSSGDVAKSQMTFARTKLDGSETQEFFDAGSVTYEYRMAEVDGVVYIVYYDATDLAIYSYNTATGEKITVAKTVSDQKDKYESLSAYMFTDVDGALAIVYSTTVYAENYIAEKASLANYARTEADYNAIYTYSVGDTVEEGNEFYGKKILDGNGQKNKYTLKYFSEDYLFYSVKNAYVDEVLLGAKLNALNAPVEIANADVLSSATLIKSFSEAYYVDTNGEYLVKASLKKSESAIRENVIKKDVVVDILGIYGNDLYYVDSANGVSRIALNENGAEAVKVSQNEIDNTWYAPSIIKIGETPYLFYINASKGGSNYVNYINLASEVKEKTENDVTTYYLEGAVMLGKMTDADYANKTEELIDAIEQELEYTIDAEGKFKVESYEKAKASLEELKKNKKAYKNLEEGYEEKLEEVEKAVKLGEYYYALKDVTSTNYSEFSSAYDTAKTYRAKLLKDGDYETARNRLVEELKFYFQEAEKLFDPVTE